MQQTLQIIEMAIKKLEMATGIQVTIKTLPDEVVLQLQNGRLTSVFNTEVRNTINTATIGQFKQNKNSYTYSPILITPYATPAVVVLLRAAHVHFLDAAGNAFINEPPLFISIQGNKPDELPNKTRRLYQSSGLKILFTLLCNPGLENDDYRKIAFMADVALGSVGWVMRDLKQSGYLVNLGKNERKLTKKEELLKNWVSNYHEHLKPKLQIGRFAALNKNWWKNVSMQDSILWGSEYAAHTITNYLKPENYTLYTDELHPEFLLANKLHCSPEGTIEILQKFWAFDGEWTKDNIVPPLLVYADLIASQSDRNIETAKIIYEKELTRLFG